MSKEWCYSTLSHEVSLHGGPEQYIRDIKTGAVLEAGPIIASACLAIGYGVRLGVEKIKKVKQKARDSEAALRQEIEQELIKEP